jgi:hypothetical protein
MGLIILTSWVLLAACGGEDNGDAYIPEAPIEVTFGTEPSTPHPAGQPLTLYVQVTQEGKPVEDAEEVQFEIWMDDGTSEEDTEQENDAEAQRGEAEHGTGEHGSAERGHAEGHGEHMAGYKSDHPFYDAVHVGDGIYELEHTFEEPGKYQVMYHVTARGYHDMVKHELEITE